MEINEKNAIAAYKAADENGKNMLKALFPSFEFESEQAKDDRPITERVKSLQDAIDLLGDEHPLVAQLNLVNTSLSYHKSNAQLFAYVSLQVICAALNEGWEPKFTEDEVRWYPWHWLYSQSEIDEMSDDEKHERNLIQAGEFETEYAGFACAPSNYAPSYAYASFGSRLCLKSESLATYCGTQFIREWADFKLSRK